VCDRDNFAIRLTLTGRVRPSLTRKEMAMYDAYNEFMAVYGVIVVCATLLLGALTFFSAYPASAGGRMLS